MKLSLIEFSVENFRIFSKRATFAMHARKSSHTFKAGGENLLRTSLVYGPNASGKSTLLDAFKSFTRIILHSSSKHEQIKHLYQPFKFGETDDKPIFFKLIFSLDDRIFNYNFSFLEDEVITENLSELLSSGKEKTHFQRKKQDINVSYPSSAFKKGRTVADEMTRKDVLFLSAASQWNNELAMQITKNVKYNMNLLSGVHNESYAIPTLDLFKDDKNKRKMILSLLKNADFCIDHGEIEVVPDSMKEKIKQQSPNTKNIPDDMFTVSFWHKKFNSKGNKVGVDKLNIGEESEGTRNFFFLLGPIINTLENGKVLFIDELDNSVHPLLTKFIIDLFEENNPNNAQLVATTHDTSLLSHEELNKEHFWFTEKNRYGSAELFSLAEFKLRNDIDFSQKYLEGRFGALPFITRKR